MRPVLRIYPDGPVWNVYENVNKAERKSSYSSSAYVQDPSFVILEPADAYTW